MERQNKINDEIILLRNSIKQDEFWLMPFGLFMDLWEGHRQYNGISKPKQNLTIDEIILYGI